MDDSTPDAFRNRRAFLVWAIACGFAPPARMVERIVREVETGE